MEFCWMTIRRSQWSRDVSRETKKKGMMCDQLAREGMLDTRVEPSPCLADMRPGFRSSYLLGGRRYCDLCLPSF